MPALTCPLVAVLFLVATAPSAHAASTAVVVVPDKLCFPGEEIHIEATLHRSGLLGLFKSGIQGELLRFIDPQGERIRDLLTDPSGSARIRYTAGAPGRYPITVRLLDNPRYAAEPATGNVFVRDTKVPLLFVTVEAGLMPAAPSPLLARDPESVKAEPGSQKALSEVAPCYMPVYLTQTAGPSSAKIRSWLEQRGYPVGPIFLLDRPLMAGVLSEAPPPDTDVLESLWKERSLPAYLLTRDSVLAKAAADKGIRVLLLEPKSSEDQDASSQEAKGERDKITYVQEWSKVAETCSCEQ